MIYILLALVAIIVITLLLTLLFSKNESNKEVTSGTIAKEVSEECCGAHEICEEDFLMISSPKIEYYNDDELDRFKNHCVSDYSTKDIEEFRNVLLTLRENEVAGWMKSMQLRSITLPIEIRDEALLIISERRYNS